MKNKILILVIGMFLLSFTSAYQTYYRLDLNYSLSEISVSNLEVGLRNNSIENNFGYYFAGVFSYDGEILNLSFFDVPNIILWDSVDEKTGEISFGGEVILDKVDFEIYVPYYENAKEIIIYDENLTELDKIDVSRYSKDYRKVSGTEETQENVSVQEEVKPEKISSEEKVNYVEKAREYWWILIVIFVALLLKLIWDLTSKKK